MESDVPKGVVSVEVEVVNYPSERFWVE